VSPNRSHRVVIPDKRLALALGVAGLVFAAFCFDQAWEARGQERPRAAKWLAI
jgi:hypothetical protein